MQVQPSTLPWLCSVLPDAEESSMVPKCLMPVCPDSSALVLLHGHFGTSAETSWVQNVLVSKCLDTTADWIYRTWLKSILPNDNPPVILPSPLTLFFLALSILHQQQQLQLIIQPGRILYYWCRCLVPRGDFHYWMVYTFKATLYGTGSIWREEMPSSYILPKICQLHN